MTHREARTSTVMTASIWYDLLLALLAWAEFVVQVAIWLATIIPSLAADMLAYWARNLVYLAEMAGWNLYLLARRALVMSGFQMPNPEEIDFSLTTLGVGNSGSGFRHRHGAGRPAWIRLDHPGARRALR